MSFELGTELGKSNLPILSSILEQEKQEANVITQVQDSLIKAVVDEPTSFPVKAMGGLAEYFASLYNSCLEPPKEFFYFSFLTCLGSILADKLTLASEIRPQPRLFTVLLGESGDDRKSTAASKTIELFKESVTDFPICYGIGSAEGLQSRLAECDPQRLLLFFDEMKAFISKCRIEASVLLPCVNTLFESNRYESRTKNSTINLENAYLSILAASTIQTYQTMWSSQFIDIGFCNRLLVVPGHGQRKFSIPQQIPKDEKNFIKGNIGEILQYVGDNKELIVTPEAQSLYDGWYMNREQSIHAKRLETYALRLMPLLAINDQKTVVDVEIVEKVTQLMNWQLEMRKLHDPIDADNTVAQMEERIRRNLSSRPMSNRDLKRYCHIERFGIWFFDTAIKNLTKAKEITWDKKIETWRLL
jgi:hypothetical protein